MKTLKAFGLIILTTIALAGCVTKNPNYNPAQPATPASGNNPAYVPDPNIAKYTATATGANQATAPVDPYAPLVQTGIEAAAGIVTALSLLFANKKNNQANTATAAAQHLATVLPDNMVTQAINSAATPAIAASVAAHLQSAPDTGTFAIKQTPA
jgi:PBP1b-binding outer membrane lipoprotein LpoB